MHSKLFALQMSNGSPLVKKKIHIKNTEFLKWPLLLFSTFSCILFNHLIFFLLLKHIISVVAKKKVFKKILTATYIE